jgi:hypothetical protein
VAEGALAGDAEEAKVADTEEAKTDEAVDDAPRCAPA